MLKELNEEQCKHRWIPWRRDCRKRIIIFCYLLKIFLFHWSEDMRLTVMVKAHFTWVIVMRGIPAYQRICLLMPGCRCRSHTGRRSENESVSVQ